MALGVHTDTKRTECEQDETDSKWIEFDFTQIYIHKT